MLLWTPLSGAPEGAFAVGGPGAPAQTETQATQTPVRTAPDESGPSYLARLAASTPIQPANEIRALWVVRDALVDVDTVDRMIDFAIQSRFHLLFVQVRGRGDAYYRSSIEPPAPELKAPLTDFDPLQYLLIRAHRAGIAVHAWVNVFYVWSNGGAEPPAGHVVRTHPEWLLSSTDGTRMDARSVKWWQHENVEGYYLSPAQPEARRYIASVVKDLVSHYPLDGVHLDYVRYPSREITVGKAERTRFALRWGFDPVALDTRRDELTEQMGERTVAVMDSIYTAWRAAGVDSTVALIREATGALPLSAAVVPDPQRAYYEKGQDWVEWVQRGLVDFVVPMVYMYTPQEIQHQTQVYDNMIGRDRFLLGLALYNGQDEHLAETLPLIRAEGAAGFSLFSYNVLAAEPFAAQFIEQSVFATLPDSLTAPPDSTGDSQ